MSQKTVLFKVTALRISNNITELLDSLYQLYWDKGVEKHRRTELLDGLYKHYQDEGAEKYTRTELLDRLYKLYQDEVYKNCTTG
jgi:hypothetical protein